MIDMIGMINTDLMIAKKARNKFNNTVLITLKGEIQRAQANMKETATNDEVFSVVKKMISNLNDTVKQLTLHGRSYHDEANEIAILEKYLPTQLSEEKVRKEVLEIIATLEERNMKQMGHVMTALKAKYTTQVDGALASKVIKEELQ